MSRIQIIGLAKQFKGHLAVDHVTLTVEDGDFVVLLGPSGCGKTTLLRMIAGLLAPSSGRILLDGVDVTGSPAKSRQLAMVFQSYALYPHLDVEQNLAFPLRAARTPKRERDRRINEVAQTLGITELLHRKPREMSGGQRQRVAVGRALVRRPSAYLMDEPLSNLDATLRSSTRHELSELHERLEATFVYVTHDQVEAMTMATKIVVLNEGRIEQIGAPDEVYDTPRSVFVASFLGAPPMNLVPAVIDSHDKCVTLGGEGLVGRLWDGASPHQDVTLGVRPEHLRPDDGGPAALRAEGIVQRMENLGSDQLVHVRTGDNVLVMRADRGLRLIRGETARLCADLDHIHLFDAATGRRLEWIPDAAHTATDETVVAESVLTH